MDERRTGILIGLASALLFGLGAPVSKLLLPHAGDAEAMGVAQRIREEFRVSSAALLKRDTGVTMSAGVASRCSPRPANADQLVAMADSALYKAKDAGRDCTSVCSPQVAKA